VGLFSPGAPADPTSPVATRGKLVVAALMTGILVLALMGLQQAFNRADTRKAFTAVSVWRPSADGPPVLQRLIELNNGAPPACDAQVMSSFSGKVLVACTVSRDPEPYAFAVQIDTGLVRAGNDSTARRLGLSTGALPPPAPSPTPSPAAPPTPR
jgi:hypothetical protein